MDAKKPIALSAVLMALFAGLAAADASLNDSILLVVNSLPLILLAITGLVGIIGAVISIIVLVILVVWFRDILYIPLDLVKGAMKDLKKGR